jgi:hypothetical protein
MFVNREMFSDVKCGLVAYKLRVTIMCAYIYLYICIYVCINCLNYTNAENARNILWSIIVATRVVQCNCKFSVTSLSLTVRWGWFTPLGLCFRKMNWTNICNVRLNYVIMTHGVFRLHSSSCEMYSVDKVQVVPRTRKIRYGQTRFCLYLFYYLISAKADIL